MSQKLVQGAEGAGGSPARRWGLLKSLVRNVTLGVLTTAAMASGASAEVLLMPNRQARTTAPVVVWGVHTQNGSPNCTIDFGDGSSQVCTGADRSYVSFAHNYALQGTYTITMTVGAESATSKIDVYNPAQFLDGGAAGTNNRNLGINMAIQDGLRYLWTSQSNRAANFPASTTTFWSESYGFPYATTSLAVLAFENQGYKITPNVAPTGIYEKYIVRRGLNYVLSQLAFQTLTPAGSPAGSACVGTLAGANYADCRGLVVSGDEGYGNAMAILGFAGSSALAQVNTEVPTSRNGVANDLVGKTYGEVLQRLVNSMSWGQGDSNAGRGGWYYTYNSTALDGSTMGWTTLALLDATAAGATIPSWVPTEYVFGFKCALNTDGSFDYGADCNPAFAGGVAPSPAKGGTGLLGMYYLGNPAGMPATVGTIASYISGWWSGSGGLGGNYANCNGGGGNKGCAYAMFNNFKGLKLQGIATLPGVTRPAGPGSIPAADWYADYQDWLVTNQTVPATTGGGYWGTLSFSCCASGTSISAAMAELILAPVALIAPDPTLFASVGLTPVSSNGAVGTSHTVTAFAQSSTNAPIPGVTITFSVLSGPNAGQTGSGATQADGKTTFTYTGNGGAGTDQIQAFIGNLGSNKVTRSWFVPVATCDMNNDGKIDRTDIAAIVALRNKPASVDPRADANLDGIIDVIDARICTGKCTNASCAP